MRVEGVREREKEKEKENERGWIVFIVPEGQFHSQTVVNTTKTHYTIQQNR